VRRDEVAGQIGAALDVPTISHVAHDRGSVFRVLFFQKPPTAKLFLPFKFDGRPDRKRPKFTGRQRPIKIDGYTILQIPKIREEIVAGSKRGGNGHAVERSLVVGI